jgi:D-aminoacyl-tRNA deacylase
LRAVIQKVKRASVTVNGEIVGKINSGILLFLGISNRDSTAEITYVLEKAINLRIFDDADEKMNLSLLDVSGELLIVSQFTLCGDTRKGRRPSYIDAAPPNVANEIYELFVAEARKKVAKVETGKFQAMMDVELINDGPVTILIDSEKQF